MKVVEITDAIINLIKKNIIAKTNILSESTIGTKTIYVENTFHFNEGEEIVILNDKYNDTNYPQYYNILEYAKIKKIIDTRTLTVYSPIIGDWKREDNSFIQKTIAHSILYEDNVYYGDREVIPGNSMAICVEPTSRSNEWMYLQGGLSEEYKLKIMIYGYDISTDSARRIVDTYADSVQSLLNHNLHLDVTNYNTPILYDAEEGSNKITIADTEENREYFVLSSTLQDKKTFQLQDNNSGGCPYFGITNISITGGQIEITLDTTIKRTYSVSEYAVFVRLGRYLYDSRVDSITYGVVSKGSAVLRAAELSWFGKEIIEYSFPQALKSVSNPEDLSLSLSSMSSSSSSLSSLSSIEHSSSSDSSISSLSSISSNGYSNSSDSSFSSISSNGYSNSSDSSFSSISSNEYSSSSDSSISSLSSISSNGYSNSSDSSFSSLSSLSSNGYSNSSDSSFSSLSSLSSNGYSESSDSSFSSLSSNSSAYPSDSSYSTFSSISSISSMSSMSVDVYYLKLHEDFELRLLENNEINLFEGNF